MIVQVVAVFLASIAMSLALAHALELPGKLRLSKENYIATQTIYYPGFTIGGIAEGLSMVAALILIVFTPTHTQAFWWTLAGLIGLVAMHVVYWTLTHPDEGPQPERCQWRILRRRPSHGGCRRRGQLG